MEDKGFIFPVNSQEFLIYENENLNTNKFYVPTPIGIAFILFANFPSFKLGYLLNLNNIILDLSRLRYCDERFIKYQTYIDQPVQVNPKYFINSITKLSQFINLDSPLDTNSFFIWKISQGTFCESYIEKAIEKLNRELEQDKEKIECKKAIKNWVLARKMTVEFIKNIDLDVLNS